MEIKLTEKEIEKMIVGQPEIKDQFDTEGLKAYKEYNKSIVKKFREAEVKPEEIQDEWLRHKVERYLKKY